MTLPDPNNFISAYSYLPLKDGVAFTCHMPKCRYYSLTLYAGLFDPVQDRVPPSLYVVSFSFRCGKQKHGGRWARCIHTTTLGLTRFLPPPTLFT